MRASDWKRVVRPLLPDDAWAFHGRAVHRTPVRHVAIGLLAEGSGQSTGVYVWRLRLPGPSQQINWRMLEEVAGSRVLLGQAAKALESIEEALSEPQARSWDAGMPCGGRTTRPDRVRPRRVGPAPRHVAGEPAVIGPCRFRSTGRCGGCDRGHGRW